MTGVVTVTPPAGFTGTLQVKVAALAAPGAPNDTFHPHDSEIVSIVVTPDPRPWHNAPSPLDVDQDSHIVPRDALYIINEINRRTSRDLVKPLLVPAPATRLLYDTDANGYITARDILLVINQLIRTNLPEGEFVPQSNPIPEGEANSLAILDLLFADLDPLKRRNTRV